MTGILVSLCGGLGAGLRYLLDTGVKKLWTKNWPLGTLLVNLIAGGFAGLVAALSARLILDPSTRLLLATGLLGGFSTFSTAIWEVLAFLREHRLLRALAYLVAGFLGPLLMVAACFALGMSLN